MEAASELSISGSPPQLANGIVEIENERLRHIRLHERVNELPDPNYATLKFFLGHLYRLGDAII